MQESISLESVTLFLETLTLSATSGEQLMMVSEVLIGDLGVPSAQQTVIGHMDARPRSLVLMGWKMMIL